MTSVDPPKGLFTTILTSVIASGVISMASAYVTNSRDAAVFVEKLTTHDSRITSLEGITKSIAETQSSQAASVASIAATQQSMARMMEHSSQDVREIRAKLERNR